MNKKDKKNNNKNGHTFNDCVIKIKNSSNKLENNINESFNKSSKFNLLNNNKIKVQKDESNKKENKILKLLKNKVFISLSSITIILSVATPSIYFPISTFINSQNSNSLSKNENGTYIEKLNFLNQLPNDSKIQIWNSYIDETNFRWDLQDGNKDIWAYIKNNFEFFQNPKMTCTVGGQTFTIKEGLNFILNDLANNTNNYLDAKTFENKYQKQSFLNLDKQNEIYFSSQNINPILSFHTVWNGIPKITNNSGITTSSIKINFERNELNNFQMSINFNYSKELGTPSIETIPNKENYRNVPFVFAVKIGRDSVTENKGWVYNMKPINNTLKIGADFSPSFSNFNAWMINYFDTIKI